MTATRRGGRDYWLVTTGPQVVVVAFKEQIWNFGGRGVARNEAGSRQSMLGKE